MNNQIGFESLRVLDAIESAGSFNGAARMLHKVPSAISHTVSKLEEDLGIALYARIGRRAELTAAGREVLIDGRRILRAVARMQARARHAASGWEPELTIALDHLLPLQLILPALEQFNVQAPEVTVNVTRETLDGSWDALIWRRADLAIGAGGMGPPGSECLASELGSLNMLYVAAPEHPLAKLAHETPLTAEQLSAYRYIDTADTARAMQPTMQALFESRLRLSLVDLRDKLEALRSGLGFGLLPASLARTEINAGRLLAIKTETTAPELKVQFAYRRGSAGKALAWFDDVLKQNGANWLAHSFA